MIDLKKINRLLPIIANAIQNDTHLKELYNRLSQIYAKALPVIIEVSPTEFKASYSEEVNKLIDEINKRIITRQEQILSFYNTKQIEKIEKIYNKLFNKKT